jgi:dipeptidyl aminopeptidase/acylaminoacyl peptidase
VLFSANEEGYSNLYLIDGWLNHELPTPETKGIISSYSFTDDMELLFCYEFPKRPSQVYRFNWMNSQLRQLTWSCFQGINPHNFIQPELIRYKSFDGLEVPAFLFLPPNYKPGKTIPMICHFHGGPESQYRPTFSKVFQYFLELGIGICAPNIRGSSGYGSHYMALDDYKKRMDSVKDGIELAEHLIKKGYTTKEQLAVMGGSYGGFMVLALIAEAPELFAAAIDVVGVANLVTFLKNTSPYRRKLREAEYGPLSDEEFLKSISPIHKMHRVRTPLLVIHGATDPRVPLNEAEQVVETLKSNNQVVDYLFFDDEGHGIRKLSNQLTYYRKAVEFLLDHIAG